MTNQKTTKRALLASALSLALSGSMLIGTTFAWFTDTVAVSGNKIVAGTLDIELWKSTYNDWMDQPGGEGYTEENITESTDPIFDNDRWEPGYLEYTNLTVRNVGTLAAKIQAYIVPTEEVGELAEVIDVYVAYVPFADNYDNYTIRQFFNGEYILPWGGGMNMFDNYVKHVGTLKDVIENSVNLSLYKGVDALIESEDNYQINIALKMQENAGNQYQGKAAGEFDIKIVATQATVEEDGYDNNYDQNAAYPVVTMKQLEDQLNNENIPEVNVIGGRFNDTVTVPTGKTFTSENGTFIPTNKYASAVDVQPGANIVLNGGNYLSSGQQIINSQSVDSTVTINGGTYNGSCLVWNGGSSETVINDGEFNLWCITVVDTETTCTLTINGGIFNLRNSNGFTAGTSAPIVINGGTFNQDPTNWLGEGKTAIYSEESGLWIVK